MLLMHLSASESKIAHRKEFAAFFSVVDLKVRK